MADPQTHTPHLVLVGAGHAHLMVLEAMVRGAFAPARVTLVAPYLKHLYSGMLSGLMGGTYKVEDLSFDLPRLVAAGGARFVAGCAVGLDPRNHRVSLDTGQDITYDLVSFATGSGVTGIELPGVRERALPVKPIDRAILIVAWLERLAGSSLQPSIVVVGAGAGGVEVALAVRARLRKLGCSNLPVIVIDRHDRVLPDRSEAAGRETRRALARNAIELRLGKAVVEVDSGIVRLEGGDELRFDLLIWATGPGETGIFRASGLETDPGGFLMVDDALRSVSDPAVFGGGDAVTLRRFPRTPKSGVYAVRQGPVLIRNLKLALSGKRTGYQAYRPQARSLVLINTGDGQAILSYGPVALTTRWAMRLKDRIDRRFMRRFQRLTGLSSSFL